MDLHDKWVVIKVQRGHAKPVRFGHDNKTILPKEELNEMDWFREKQDNQQRCCEQGIRPSDRSLENLREETKAEIEYFECNDNKYRTKCRGTLIRQKSSSAERTAPDYLPYFQGFLGMNVENPSIANARQLQIEYNLDEALCNDLLSKYPLPAIELVSIKLDQNADNDAPRDMDNYILPILEMDIRSYPDKEWCHKFKAMQDQSPWQGDVWPLRGSAGAARLLP